MLPQLQSANCIVHNSVLGMVLNKWHMYIKKKLKPGCAFRLKQRIISQFKKGELAVKTKLSMRR